RPAAPHDRRGGPVVPHRARRGPRAARRGRRRPPRRPGAPRGPHRARRGALSLHVQPRRGLRARAPREERARQAGAGSGDDLAAYLYDKRGDQAIEHVFRVAASLDSMVLGEPQILGQVKDAYEAAVAAGALKGTLSRCVSRAFTVAKRVRTETAIGTGTVSISSVAVDLAGRIFGGLSDHAVLLLGAGEMAEAAARSLGEGASALRI